MSKPRSVCESGVPERKQGSPRVNLSKIHTVPYYRPHPMDGEGNVFSLFICRGGTYLGWVPTLAGGYLPWSGGYLPWLGVPHDGGTPHQG